MPIVVCSGCAKKLRVPDDKAGKKAKCPHCNSIFVVPQPGEALQESAPLPPRGPGPSQTADRWSLKTPEGQTFGPVSKSQLDSWVAEGRVSAQSQVLREGADQWQWASEVYPVLATTAGAAPSATGSGSANPFADIASRDDRNPYASPHVASTGRQRTRKRPHRGGTILTLALVGWFFCVIFSIMAWTMGSEDMREMRMGRMDASGMGMTQAGTVLGMIHCILSILGIVFGVLMLLMGVVRAA